jgi:hypothetical protein
MFAAFAILSGALFLTPGADTALEPWASKAQAGDVANRHIEEVAKGEHKYTVVHGVSDWGRFSAHLSFVPFTTNCCVTGPTLS